MVHRASTTWPGPIERIRTTIISGSSSPRFIFRPVTTRATAGTASPGSTGSAAPMTPWSPSGSQRPACSPGWASTTAAARRTWPRSPSSGGRAIATTHGSSSRALADYRNGRFGQANARLDRIRATQEDAELLIHSDLILAMAHHRLGDGAKALKHLAAASRAHDAFLAGSRGDLGESWHDWVIVGLLRREAEATILYDPIFPANPFARGTTSR